MRFLIALGVIIAALAFVAITAAGLGQMRWNRASGEAVRRLREEARPPAGGAWQEVLDQVPGPVGRYLRFALAPGQCRVASAKLDQEGDFLTTPGGRYSPFTAVEHFASTPPAFVWNASIGGAPLINVRVRDGYRDGHGFMVARLAGLFTVADGGDTPQLAQGALARYLAEAAWIPTLLLPGERLSWQPVDDSAARATLTDRGVSVTLDFHFAPDGSIARVSGTRYRDVDGHAVLTPWEGRFRDYTRMEGMMVPATGEVSWLLPDGPYTYWRGRITGWEYACAP